MSNNESFIDEVTEEVRRDKLFATFRKYGWIGVAAVLLLVGGASMNEVLKARERAAAEATGDAILSAVTRDITAAKLSALDEIGAEGELGAALGLIGAGELTGDLDAAGARLAAVAADPAAPQLYRDLAVLKRAMLPGQMTPEERVTALSGLTGPGAPFRVLAEEQIAFAEIELGQGEAARTRLEALLEDNEASGALRQRAQQLIVALGGGETAGDGA
jgi:hypothetical protein